MDGELVLFVGRRTLETALIIAAPALGVMVVVGFLVAIFQAITSVRDMTLGIAIKLGCLGLTLLVCGGWMMQVAEGFTREVFNHLMTISP
ncbi:MAG: flagellar biosynthetic protein FliQ [Planctomycetota bacterium]|jgi:flagellar biosynthetic protein FliQ